MLQFKDGVVVGSTGVGFVLLGEKYILNDEFFVRPPSKIEIQIFIYLVILFAEDIMGDSQHNILRNKYTSSKKLFTSGPFIKLSNNKSNSFMVRLVNIKLYLM